MFNFFPYTNFHRLNADWILEKMREADQAVQDAKAEVDAAVAIMDSYNEHLSILDQGVSSNANQIQTVAENLSTLAGTVATQADRINSINTGLTDLASHAVQTYEQEFSDAEKAQARENIGAASQASVEPLAPIPGQVQALTDTVNTHNSQIISLQNRATILESKVNTHSNQIQGLQNSVTTLDSRVITNSSNIDTLISQSASHGSQITNLQSSVTQLRTDVDAIVQPVVVTLSYANGAYELSMSVTDICQLLADGEQPVIINAQAVDNYPNMPLSSAAVRDVQLSSIKSDAVGNVDGFEAQVTLAQGTAQETRMLVRASAQEPDLIEVSWITIPIGGGGVEPVTVTVDTVNNTWSGATWTALVNAFNHGSAFANINGLVMNFDHYYQDPNGPPALFTGPNFTFGLNYLTMTHYVIIQDGTIVENINQLRTA